jgi:hypothetical protein
MSMGYRHNVIGFLDGDSSELKVIDGIDRSECAKTQMMEGTRLLSSDRNPK